MVVERPLDARHLYKNEICWIDRRFQSSRTPIVTRQVPVMDALNSMIEGKIVRSRCKRMITYRVLGL